MAKTIKFNLICDNNPVRSIEDLQENFSIEDVLKYYQNGLLLRWLKVRGYDDEYKKVSDIKEIEALEVVKELIKIFDVEVDDKKVEEGVYMLRFLKERKELCEVYKQNDFKAKSIVNDYQAGYKQLIDGIIDNPDDVARIKANISELMTNYKWAMDLNHRELFWNLKDRSSLAIMCLLMNEEARKYYLPMPIKRVETSDTNEEKKVNFIAAVVKGDSPITITYDTENNADKRNMYNAICAMIKASDFVSKLGENLHIFSGVTDGYWKDLETKEKKYMIISMGSGDFVRGAGIQGGDLSSTDVENKFVIVEGIDYKSNSSTRQLLYMEV